jgi:hypothetical protein
VVLNNGGYGRHQYVQCDIGTICYFDGENFDSIYTVETGDFITIFDIAVDTIGQAWVFSGPEPDSITQLTVLDSMGSVEHAYSFNASTNNGYGSFFLNGTLYVGYGYAGPMPNTIRPVILDGTSAYFGTPILFMDYEFQDMASCQSLGEFVSILEHEDELNLSLYPNPTSSTLTIRLPDKKVKADRTSIYDMTGRLVHRGVFDSNVDVSFLQAGMYTVLIETNNGVFRGNMRKE